MKISDQFILRNIAGEYILVPTGDAAFQVKGLIMLSESGAMQFNRLKEGCTLDELVAALTREYDVSEQEARLDTLAFLEQMRKMKILIGD